MSVAQNVFKNTTFLFVAEGASRLVSAVLSIAVARQLGATQLGQYAYVISIITIANVFAEFGLTAYLIKHQATADEQERRKLAGQVTFLRIVLAVTVFAAVLLYSITSVSDPTTRALVLIASLGLFASIYSSICIGELRVKEMMAYEAMSRFGAAVLTTLAGLTILWLGFGVIGLIILSVVIQVLISLFFVGIAWRQKLSRVVHRSSLSQTKVIFSGVLPFALVSVLVTIYFRIDAIMIEHTLGSSQLGYYAAVYKIMEMLLTIPVLLSATLFPTLSKHLLHDPALVFRGASQAIKFLAMVALPLVFGGIVLAPEGIVALYSADYTPSIVVFQVLVLTLVPVFISAVTSTLISAGRKPMVNTYIAAAMVVLNISLNLMLIPWLGIVGAAAATVATELIGMLLGLIYIHFRVGRLEFASGLLKPALASICMAAVIWLHPSLWLLPVYAVVYVVTLRLLRPFTSVDRDIIYKIAPPSTHRLVRYVL